jgi:transcriptional regulator with PAS, ATPase and Fis domain
MKKASWIQEFPAAITVCDANGIILEMNARAVESFTKDGGASLIGKNVKDCHAEPARTKLAQLLELRSANCYTIEKGGVKRLIYQSPWYEAGEYRGIVELSIPIPFEMPHFIRDVTNTPR